MGWGISFSGITNAITGGISNAFGAIGDAVGGAFSGIFGSKTQTTVGTQIQRVINDSSVPNSLKAATTRALLLNSLELGDYQAEALTANFNTKVERMYRYAAQSYTYGLPSGSSFSSVQGLSQAEGIIEYIEGKQVSIEYAYFGVYSFTHAMWVKLVQSYQYNYETNEIASLTLANNNGALVYLKDFKIIVPSTQSNTITPMRLSQWGTAPNAGYTPQRTTASADIRNTISPSNIVYDINATEPYGVIEYTWTLVDTVTNTTTVHNQSIIVPLTDVFNDSSYYQIKYYVDGLAKFWTYKYGQGTYSTLDDAYATSLQSSGTYLPMTYFRLNGVPLNASGAAYTTSVKMLKYLGLSYDELRNNINSNPDIGSVQQAILLFAVPAVSTNQTECKYLFNYFDNQLAISGGNNSDSMKLLRDSTVVNNSATNASISSTTLSNFLLAANRNTIDIQDRAFRISLHNNGIYKRLRLGTVGPVNTYTSEFTTVGLEQNVTVINNNISTTSVRTTTIPAHRYCHQLTNTTYEEVIVSNLKTTFYIAGSHVVVADETDPILIIPIDKSVTREFSSYDREILYARSLHLVFNSLVVQKIKWYQQSWFSAALVIVGITLTVISFGADGGSWVATALALTGTSAVVATVIFTIVIGTFILPKVFNLFVKTFGKEIAIAAAILAIVYGGKTLIQAGIKGAPTAATMLSISTGLSNSIMKAEMARIAKDYELFNIYQTEQTERLKKAEALLNDNDSILSPLEIIGESAEDYFNRTRYYGNIGILTIDAISSYVKVALALPKIDDTLIGF